MTLCVPSGNVIGRLFNAGEEENNFSVDTRDRICVMVVKSSECFPYAGERRNKAKCIARF